MAWRVSPRAQTATMRLPFDGDVYPENPGLEGQCQIIFDHVVEAGGLLVLVVAVDGSVCGERAKFGFAHLAHGGRIRAATRACSSFNVPGPDDLRRAAGLRGRPVCRRPPVGG